MSSEDVNVSVGEEDEINFQQPESGMKFGGLDEVWEFYKEYGKQAGFPVRKCSSRKNVAGEIRSYTFGCARGGTGESNAENPLKPQPTQRCACEARIVARLDQFDGWLLSKVILEHNHELCPSQTRFYRCNRYINPRVRNQIDLLDRSGVPLNKSYNSLVNEAGGYENMTCSEKDCRNLVDKLRRLRLGEGDAAAIMRYFTKKVAENSGFFFDMDVDDQGHLKNVFWADGRCREAYKEFGEVISFDTTYLVNKYEMPFAPFVGVNHHGHSMLFGCGLVAHEDTESFVWLFSKWLDCMSGYAPPAIITDQDRAMQNAIAVVFPNARHRWCLWHVMKKLPEKFRSYAKFENITCTMKKAVYNSQYPRDFEMSWNAMMVKYNLVDNDWLTGLFEERRRWVPCYLNDTFWAGMASTQRSESMNSFFDEYVNAKTTLKQFVEKYEQAFRDKVEKETKADSDSSSKSIPTSTFFEMEKQIQEVYTLSKYKEFQKQLTSQMYCKSIEEVTDLDGLKKIVVSETMWVESVPGKVVIQVKEQFDVAFDPIDYDISCSCRMFESKGILCRHVVFVLIDKDVKFIPEKYILRRWRKDVRRLHTSMRVNVSRWQKSVEHERFNDLNLVFSEAADRAVKGEDQYKSLKQILVTQLEMLKLGETSSQGREDVEDNEDNEENGENGEDRVDQEANDILDPLHTRRKGRPRSTRLQSSWKGKKHTAGNDGNNGDDVTPVLPKKRGRPRRSKNKKHNTVEDPIEDVTGQQTQELQQTQESVVSNEPNQQSNFYYRMHPYAMQGMSGLPPYAMQGMSGLPPYAMQGMSGLPQAQGMPGSLMNMLVSMENGRDFYTQGAPQP